MPDTELESLIARAESGDWWAVGQLIEQMEEKGYLFEARSFKTEPRASRFGGIKWYEAATLPAAIARAARAALEGETHAD